jgi:hypothetical protein
VRIWSRSAVGSAPELIAATSRLSLGRAFVLKKLDKVAPDLRASRGTELMRAA